MFNFTNVNQIESLFNNMGPENLGGESFTPSLHQDEIILDDSEAEPENGEEVDSMNESSLGPFAVFTGSDVPVPLAAVDVGVIDLGLSRTGFALAFKGAVVMQALDGTHTVAKIGPRLKFIAPNNRAEILKFIGQELGDENLFVEIHTDGSLTIKAGAREPNQFKDRIRNFIERILHLEFNNEVQL